MNERWNLWDLNGFLHDLQQWNLHVPGHLVDLFMDCVFLHFNCVDDVLNARVHNLLRLSDKALDDLLRESNIGSFNGLLRRTLLKPVQR